MNLKHILLASVLGVLFGATATHYTSLEKIKSCEFKVANSQKQINEFCAGQDIGGARLVSVTCEDRKEICVCGTTDMLKPLH